MTILEARVLCWIALVAGFHVVKPLNSGYAERAQDHGQDHWRKPEGLTPERVPDF